MIYNTIIIQGGLLTMSVRYNEDFKLEVVKAYMAGDRSTAELSAEYMNATIKIPHLKILKLMLLRRLED